jgi:hypothetical protein
MRFEARNFEGPGKICVTDPFTHSTGRKEVVEVKDRIRESEHRGRRYYEHFQELGNIGR